MQRYLTTKKKQAHNFSAINIRWVKSILMIDFKKDGFLSETFIAIQCLKTHPSPIENIYLISIDSSKCIIKEVLWGFKLKNLNYSEFIDYLTNAISGEIENSSGDFFTKKTLGLELRFADKTEHLFPTVIGFEINIEKIHDQVWYNRHRNFYN